MNFCHDSLVNNLRVLNTLVVLVFGSIGFLLHKFQVGPWEGPFVVVWMKAVVGICFMVDLVNALWTYCYGDGRVLFRWCSACFILTSFRDCRLSSGNRLFFRQSVLSVWLWPIYWFQECYLLILRSGVLFLYLEILIILLLALLAVLFEVLVLSIPRSLQSFFIGYSTSKQELVPLPLPLSLIWSFL